MEQALQNNNVAELDCIYADQFVFVEDGNVTPKKERLDALRSGKVKFESLKIDVHSVHTYGDVAVAVMNITNTALRNGKMMNGKYLVTGTFAKNNGSWQEIAASVMPANK